MVSCRSCAIHYKRHQQVTIKHFKIHLNHLQSTLILLSSLVIFPSWSIPILLSALRSWSTLILLSSLISWFTPIILSFLLSWSTLTLIVSLAICLSWSTPSEPLIAGPAWFHNGLSGRRLLLRCRFVMRSLSSCFSPKFRVLVWCVEELKGTDRA